jgi:general secretion pathway protein J
MSGAPLSVHRSRQVGFTLIELLIAISLMAVLAVLGWRGLDSVLRGRERIVAASDSLRGLSVGFTQIEEDLRRAWPVRLLNLPLPIIGFLDQGIDGPPALQLFRELPPSSGPSQVQRVVYRLRKGVFERGFAPWGVPSADRPATVSDDAMIWQPLLQGVTGVQMRGWVVGRGWIPAGALVASSGAGAQALQVTGLEVLIERGPGDRVLRIFAVKD